MIGKAQTTANPRASDVMKLGSPPWALPFERWRGIVPVCSGTILELLPPSEGWVDFNDMPLPRFGKVRYFCVRMTLSIDQSVVLPQDLS
jgi:hypothetical protein